MKQSRALKMIVVVALPAAAGILSSCSGSKSGGQTDAGGPWGTGGAAANDAAIAGSGGVLGTGGASVIGNGGATTSKGTGGAGNVGTGGMGAGGAGIDGGAGKAMGGAAGFGGTGKGGSGTGGSRTGGTGGATARDGGPPDAPLPKCSEVTTEADCNARADCHSVYQDPGTCGCGTPGCCARFRSCADGDKADCAGTALCEMVTPFCELPYLIAYKNDCYEGCVRESDCAIPECPKSVPKAGASCGGARRSCFYDDCGSAGRVQADCRLGVWEIDASPCVAQSCGENGTTLTCDAGEVCVITTNMGGALIITPTCVDHDCGAGPLTTQCIPGLYGACEVSSEATGMVVRCTYSSCGDPRGCP